MAIDRVISLTILELVRTLQSYLEVGRVKATLIFDAARVVLVGTLISLWHCEYMMRGMAGIVLSILLRIVTAGFSPQLRLYEGDRRATKICKILFLPGECLM